MQDHDLQLADPSAGQNAPRADLLTIFQSFTEKAMEVIATAKTINVTARTQTSEMQLARRLRLQLKEIRVAAGHKHKELKAYFLDEGRKVDAVKNQILALIEPLEEKLQASEDFIALDDARIVAELKSARESELQPFTQTVDVKLMNLGAMSQAEYDSLLSDFKTAHADRLERERNAEADRIAKEAAEKAEAERICVENARLKAEAEEREKVLAEERQKFDEERKAADEAARLTRERIEKHAAEEKAKQQAEADRLKRETEAKEREAREAQQRAEAALAEERRKVQEAEATKLAEQKRLEAERLEAERVAALAPDIEKLNLLASKFRSTSYPPMSTDNGRVAVSDIADKVDKLVKYIEQRAKLL